MRNHKLLSVIFALLLILPAVVSCTGGSGDVTTAIDVPTEVDTELLTTAPELTTSIPVITDEAGAIITELNEKTVHAGSTELGFVPVYASVSEGDACWVMTENSETLITPVKSGISAVTFYNSYGETATASVSVSADGSMNISYVKFKAPERVFNVLDFDAKPNQNVDSTNAINSAIEAAHNAGGGTVYVPKGSYKVNSIRMRSGVSLKLEGFIPDARVGYSAEVKKYVQGNNAAKFSTSGSSRNNIFIYNTPLPKAYCTEGESDFSFSGGVILCEGKMKFAAIACGSNITFENILIKDTPNNHSFQIDACENLTISNVLFAGYNYSSSDNVLTRETIQLEPTTPGSITSDTANSPIQCTSGDYHTNKNITVTGCYFGKSDLYGPHLVAVGHHSQTGAISSDGFVFTNNKIENPLYCGLHLPNASNVVISGNEFISNTKSAFGRLADDSALISLYSFSGDSTYTDANGNKIMYAFSYEQNGIRDYIIENNSFELGEYSYLRAIYIQGASSDNRLNAVFFNSSNMRVAEFGGKPFAGKGFAIKTNTAYNITIRNNKINVTSRVSYADYFVHVKNVIGFFWENNEVELGTNAKFTVNSDLGKGFNLVTIITDRTTMLTRKVGLDKAQTKTVTVTDGKTSFEMPKPTVTCSFTIEPTEGGRVELTADKQGNLTVSVIADEGYSFTGFVKKADGSAFDLNQSLSGFTELRAVFVKN